MLKGKLVPAVEHLIKIGKLLSFLMSNDMWQLWVHRTRNEKLTHKKTVRCKHIPSKEENLLSFND